MVGQGEVRHPVRQEEGLDVAHEGVAGGHHAADVAVDAAYDELIPPLLFEHLFELGALEGAVAPLDQHNIVRLRTQPCHHLLQLGALVQTRAPHVIEQGAIFGGLILGLGGVEDRNAEGLALLAHGDQALGQGRDQRAVLAIEGGEVLLHVVDQQGGAFGIQGPVDLVGLPLAGHGVVVQGWDSHNVMIPF
ncbi:hypothetical protein D3C77_487620 [compost metagenome]